MTTTAGHSKKNVQTNLTNKYLVLCHNTTLVAKHVLPHKVRLLKLYRPMYRHIRIDSYPQHRRIRAENTYASILFIL